MLKKNYEQNFKAKTAKISKFERSRGGHNRHQIAWDFKAAKTSPKLAPYE